MKYPAESYTHEECLAILDACGDSGVGRRNRALIVLLWRCGLRLAEALALRVEDVDFAVQTVRVLHGKGDKARTVGFDVRAADEIGKWLEVRGEWQQEKSWTVGPLICTRRGKALTQAYVRSFLPRVARKAGIAKRVHAHGFRHTFAVELARERVPVIHIQRLLGHSSLATTSVYLASLSPEEALDAVRGREW